MADRRFYFWESYGKAMDLLTDEEAGRFIKACCAFAFEGTEPDFSDQPKLAFAFGMIRGQLLMSVEIGVKAVESGKKGGRPSKKTTAKRGAKTTPKSTPETTPERGAESDMNMNVNVGASASLDGSASAPDSDGGDSDEY